MAVGRRSGRLAAVAGIAVVALAVTTVVHPGAGEYFTGRANAGRVIEAADRVGDYLAEHTRADDEVLTLWAQPAGLESGRDNVPGVTVGPFSYEDLSPAEARDLHYVNADDAGRNPARGPSRRRGADRDRRPRVRLPRHVLRQAPGSSEDPRTRCHRATAW